MFALRRLFLYFLLICATIGGFYWVFHKKEFRWRRLLVFLAFFLVCFYFIFLCTSPMKPKINEASLENGARNIIEYSLKNKKEPDDNETTLDINKALPELSIVDNNICYIISVYKDESEELAKKTFDYWVRSYRENESEKLGEIEFFTSKFYRSRNWTYLGVAGESRGDIYILYDEYVITIYYWYESNLFEENIDVVCPSETFYREEVDLEHLNLEDADISYY